MNILTIVLLINLLNGLNANDLEDDSVYYANNGTEVDITAGPPTYDKPWVPAWGFFEGYNTSWKQKHLDLLKTTKENGDKIKVIYVGDSLTDYFSTTGKEVWNQYYSNLGVYNYGIGGDSTREILWRIENGEFDGISPKLLILLIGTNNLNDEHGWHPWVRGTDDEIVKAIKIILDTFHQKLSNTTLLLLSLLPQGGDDRNVRIRNINSHISLFSDNKTIHYFDLYSHFMGANNKQISSLFSSDTVHLTKDGYMVWANSIANIFKLLSN